jgi:sucrose-6-phosphate hydrolase SacC (GH32 family)
VLLFSSHLQGTQYYVGTLEGLRFRPETHRRTSWPGGQLGGPRTLLDGTGRRILFDWVRELRDEDRARASGWAGVMSLPKVLTPADDGALRIEPVPELAALRLNRRVRRNIELAADSEVRLHDVRGDCLELCVVIEPEDALEVGVKVRCSDDGAEQTAVSYDRTAGKLRVDISRSTLDGSIRYYRYNNLNIERNAEALQRLPEKERLVGAQEAPFKLAGGETLELRIFLDHSMLEVFANDRQCVTQRIYPTLPDSLDVTLFARGGGATVRSVEAWDMAPAHD